MRSVAAAAQVDPSLLVHFFTNKQQLFLAAMLPTYQGPALLEGACKGDHRTFGLRIAEIFCSLMENLESRQVLLGMIRASAAELEAAEIMKSFIEHQLLEPMAKYIGGADGDLRASLIGSQLVGVCLTRYITKLEPIASVKQKQIIALLGPAIQQYL